MKKRDFFLHLDDIISIIVGMVILEGSQFLFGDRVQYRGGCVIYFIVIECVLGIWGWLIFGVFEVLLDEMDN